MDTQHSVADELDDAVFILNMCPFVIEDIFLLIFVEMLRDKDLRINKSDHERRLNVGREITAVIGSRAPARLRIEDHIPHTEEHDQSDDDQKPDKRDHTEGLRLLGVESCGLFLDRSSLRLIGIACSRFLRASIFRLYIHFVGKSTCPGSVRSSGSVCARISCIRRHCVIFFVRVLFHRNSLRLLPAGAEQPAHVQKARRRCEVNRQQKTHGHDHPEDDQDALRKPTENKTEQQNDKNRDAAVKAHLQYFCIYSIHPEILITWYASRSSRSVSPLRLCSGCYRRFREMHLRSSAEIPGNSSAPDHCSGGAGPLLFLQDM